eukprot:9310877-Prorocentrum_lima.AAC.1
MARGKRQGPLHAHLVFSTLEESDASHTMKNASKHVADDEGTQTKEPTSVCSASTSRHACRDP